MSKVCNEWNLTGLSEDCGVAYEVIKRVSGRAYRYRVESYRDPETRRVRGKWTYLGRVEGEGTLSPERKARPSSRDRLLDAVERLLETNELASDFDRHGCERSGACVRHVLSAFS